MTDPKPIAEIVGGVLRWHVPAPDYVLAQQYLRGTHMLYDSAALDAAVAAEQKRWADGVIGMALAAADNNDLRVYELLRALKNALYRAEPKE